MNERLLFTQPPSSLSFSLNLGPQPGMHPPFLLANPYPMLGLSSDTVSFLPKSFEKLRGHVPVCASSFLGSDGPLSLCRLTSQGKDIAGLIVLFRVPCTVAGTQEAGKKARKVTGQSLCGPVFRVPCGMQHRSRASGKRGSLGGNPPVPQLHPRAPPCCPSR